MEDELECADEYKMTVAKVLGTLINGKCTTSLVDADIVEEMSKTLGKFSTEVTEEEKAEFWQTSVGPKVHYIWKFNYSNKRIYDYLSK